MNTEDLLSAATQIKELATPMLTVAVSLFSFLYVRSRAGSSGFIHDRLWRILGGKKDFHSPLLQNEYNQLSDHEKFNYSTGIRFQSQIKINETLSWLQEHNIGLEEIVKIRKFFNSKDISIRKPWLPGHNFTAILTTLLFTASTGVFLLASLPFALLTIKKTDTLIWASTSMVTDWKGYEWQVKPNDCKDGKIEESQLAIHDQMVICEIFTNKENAKYLESSMLTQKALGCMLWAFFGLITLLAARDLLIAKLAENLFERSLSNHPTQETLPL
ncbi:DUF6216 family protein [Pseudomonas knackmussii]|uniref:DUF6216 family protein n=1 Tax=Pseudomonas knackmussii TaxID=65741 RepID=UPI001362FA07|nr:DUF6216 family protein [Pseudomonas knackmussii]